MELAAVLKAVKGPCALKGFTELRERDLLWWTAADKPIEYLGAR